MTIETRQGSMFCHILNKEAIQAGIVDPEGNYLNVDRFCYLTFEAVSWIGVHEDSDKEIEYQGSQIKGFRSGDFIIFAISDLTDNTGEIWCPEQEGNIYMFPLMRNSEIYRYCTGILDKSGKVIYGRKVDVLKQTRATYWVDQVFVDPLSFAQFITSPYAYNFIKQNLEHVLFKDLQDNICIRTYLHFDLSIIKNVLLLFGDYAKLVPPERCEEMDFASEHYRLKPSTIGDMRNVFTGGSLGETENLCS